jgi:type III secretion protein T
MEGIFADYSVQMHLFAFSLGMTRLMAFGIVSPFLGNHVLDMMTRSSILTALYLIVHPLVLSQIPADLFPLTSASSVYVGALIFKEVFIGLVIGFLASLVFWAVESAGFFIDNQRGASMATEVDPLSGAQTSPVGSLFFQSATYVFYSTGMFLTFMGIVYGTYVIWPVCEFLPVELFTNGSAATFFGKCVSNLLTSMMLLAAPVVLCCLFTDMALGLVNRFAPQLNVYVLSLPIKSALAALLLIFYFSIFTSQLPERFGLFAVDLSAFRNLIP